MERLVAWYRVGSSIAAVVALVLANLLPLAGVLWFGWSVWTILIVYWLENGIVGLFNVLKMAAAAGDTGSPDALAGASPAAAPPAAGWTTAASGFGSGKVAIIPFFIVHYGIFWLVHGVFVLTLPLFAFTGDEGQPAAGSSAGPDLWIVVIATVGLFISHGLSYAFNYIGRGEFRRASVGALMFAPYGRLVILHVTIIFGAFAISALDAPVAAIAILVGLKTVMDLGFHLREHRRFAGAAG